MTCDTCGCDRVDAKLLTWAWKDPETEEKGTYTHCRDCYLDLFPAENPLTLEGDTT